jgi:CRISPR/Cas system CMR-associated protein Cmr5 small subunit
LDDDYELKIENHRKQFTEILEIKNKYNRMASFDGSCWHGVNTVNCNNFLRLTQIFFVEKKSNIKSPLERIRNVVLL